MKYKYYKYNKQLLIRKYDNHYEGRVGKRWQECELPNPELIVEITKEEATKLVSFTKTNNYTIHKFI